MDESTKRVTRLGLILDKSGSMGGAAAATIAGFNQELARLRESGEDISVTFTVFDGKVDIRYVNMPLDVVENLTPITYVPHGATALYDAIGMTIAQMEEIPRAADEDIAYLIKIFSDGQETSSKQFNSAQIAEKIENLQENDDWTFTYVGANQNLYEVSRALSIPASNMASYTGSGINASEGTLMAFACSSDRTVDYLKCRSRGMKKTKNFASDDAERVASYDV